MFTKVRFCIALGAALLTMYPSLAVAARQNTGNGSLSGPYFDTGQSKFKNVSADLLFIAINGTTVPIFDVSLQNFFWQYDNQGQKNVQLRFYQRPC
jgi:hypothetical protein